MRCPPAGITPDALVSHLQVRVDELEIRLAFQEDTLQTLGEQLAHQQELISQQQAMLQAVYRQLREVQASAGDSGADGAPADERPPHY